MAIRGRRKGNWNKLKETNTHTTQWFNKEQLKVFFLITQGKNKTLYKISLCRYRKTYFEAGTCISHVITMLWMGFRGLEL